MVLPSEKCQLPGRGACDCDGAEKCRLCPVRDRHCEGGGGGSYVRSSDLDDVGDMVCSAAGTPSPTAELLSLNDLFCRKFAVDSRHEGRMVLMNPRTAVEPDSESDDVTSARGALGERRGGGATASTVSLNDLLDVDSSSSNPSTPDGCDNFSVSDYEQLVVEGCPNALADNASLLPPPPLSLLRSGHSPSTEVKYVYVPVAEDGRQRIDSSTDSSDYTNLADDESTASGLQNPVTSRAAVSTGRSALPVASCKPVNGTDQHNAGTTYQSGIVAEKTRTCPASSHVAMNGPNGVHRPTVLLTKRRKRASLAASAIVHGFQPKGESQLTNLSSDGRPFSKSNSYRPRTVVLFKDCLDGSGTGSSDDCRSLESLDQPGFRSSDGGDTVVCEKPFSSQDDGYCTAKSNVVVPLACCQRLSKITSSSEADSTADGIFLDNSSDLNDSRSVSAPLDQHGTKNEKSDFFGMSETQLLGMANSSDPEKDLGDVNCEHNANQFSLRPYPHQSGISLGEVPVATRKLPSESVERHTDGSVGDGISRHFAGHEFDSDVRQAIGMFAFLDDQESSANAASNSGR